MSYAKLGPPTILQIQIKDKCQKLRWHFFGASVSCVIRRR